MIEYKIKDRQSKKCGDIYTVPSGVVPFRAISTIMTSKGYQMNHASARNITNSALKNLFDYVMEQMRSDLSKAERDEIVYDMIGCTQVHESLADILRDLYGKGLIEL